MGTAEAGVVHRHIEPSEPGERRVDHPPATVRVGDVDVDRRAIRRELLSQCNGSLPRSIADHDVHTRLRQQPRAGGADPGCASGDDGNAGGGRGTQTTLNTEPANQALARMGEVADLAMWRACGM